MNIIRWPILLFLPILTGCRDSAPVPIEPVYVTPVVHGDPDDPAIWINKADLSQSLILGTDKSGFLLVYDVYGRERDDLLVSGLTRPNNVDVIDDLAVVTERDAGRIRIFSLPDMTPLDGGGLDVFAGETWDEPMGVAFYKREADGELYVILSRKSGPVDGYLWQYRLFDGGIGAYELEFVRSFGRFSGVKEIESVCVDGEYVYYSDEGVGVRKYYADPDMASTELALFGLSHFAGDSEGIAVYESNGDAGYLIVSNQQDGSLNIYDRNGGLDHKHELLGKVYIKARETDGIEICREELTPRLKGGLLVAMSDTGKFHFYALDDIIP